MQNGVKVRLPKLRPEQLPPPLYRKVDTTLISPEWPDTTMKNKVGFKIIIPTIGKSESLDGQRKLEFGIMGGGAVYGGGDIKHKRIMDFKTSPLKDVWFVKGLPVFSTVEYSYGAFGQYNVNSKFALKGSFYYSTISMHNMYAPLIIASGRMPSTLDKNFNAYTPEGNTFLLNFLTRMYIMEGEAIWHLRSYRLNEGQKSKIIPSLGLSLGLMHYTPYRVIYRGWKKKKYTYAEHKANVYENDLYNLRKLGSEGQNFLPGESQYSTIAGLIGSSFTLTYLRSRWALKAEAKFSYTTTDYLDDYGKGIWYGGNVELLKENQQIGDLSSTYPQNWSSESNLKKIISFDENISQSAPRSTDGLNDWYYQFHLGMSYRLFKN
jgi:hypothetical protein